MMSLSRAGTDVHFGIQKVIPRRFNSSYAPRPFEDFLSPINVEPQHGVEWDAQDSGARHDDSRNGLSNELETEREHDVAELVTVSTSTASCRLPYTNAR